MEHPLVASFSFALCSLLFSCGPDGARTDPGGIASLSQAHQADDPTRLPSPNPLDWVESDLQEFDGLFPGRLSSPVFLPQDHPTTLRAQRWADRLFQALGARFPGRMSAIPRPLLRVLVQSTPNGLVSPLSVCLRCPVRVRGAPADLAPPSPQLVGFNHSGLVFPVQRRACADRTSQSVTAEAIVESLARNLSPCALTAAGGEILLGADCQLVPKLKGQAFAGLAITATSNVVILTSGLIESARGEEQFVGVLLHELGHYLRSHGALWTNKYNFFYRQTEAALSTRPVPEPGLQELGQQLIRATRKARVYPVPGQKLHPGLFPAIRERVLPEVLHLCPDVRCGEGGERLRALCSARLDPGFGEYPARPLPGGETARYLALESALLDCAQRISLGESQDGPALSPAQVAPWFGQVTAADLQAAPTLADLLEALSSQLEEEDRAIETLLEQALDEGLGYYTYEQEADELAAEWLALLGFDPRSLLQHLFGLMERLEPLELDTRYDFGFRRCRELYQNGWLDVASQRVRIPIGSFADPHHGLCYRIFHIDREIRAHQARAGR